MPYLILSNKQGEGLYLPGLVTTIDGTDGSFMKGASVNETTKEIAAVTYVQNYPELVVYNSDGSVKFSRRINDQFRDARSVAFDQNGDIYVAAFKLHKISSTGTHLWSRKLNDVHNHAGIAFDSSNNPIVVGSGSNIAPGYIGGIATIKYDTNGSLQFKKAVGTSGSTFAHNDVGNPVTVDSSGNIIGCYTHSGTKPCVFKYNSSGTFQWAYHYTENALGNGQDITTDASGNIYFVSSGQIVKLDPNGNVLWHKGQSRGIARIKYDDATNEMLVVFGGGTSSAMGRYSSDLSTRIWYNVIDLASGGSYQAFFDGAFDSIGNMYGVGSAEIDNNSDDRLFMMRMPGDGTATGSYSFGGRTINYYSSSVNFTSSPTPSRATTFLQNATADGAVETSASVLTNTNRTSQIWT